MRAKRLTSAMLIAGALSLAAPACLWPALADPTRDNCDDRDSGAESPPPESGLTTDPSPTDTADTAEIKHKWLLTRQRILHALDSHKDVRARDLNTSSSPDKSMWRVVRLDQNAYLFSEAHEAGAFIADIDAGRYKVVWDTGSVDEMLRCARNPAATRRIYTGRLPAPRDGGPRLYVLTSCAYAGFSRGGARFVLFRWHNGTATKELDRYISYISAEGEPRLKGQVLHVLGIGRDLSFIQASGWPLWDWTVTPLPNGYEMCSWDPVDRERGVLNKLIAGIDQRRPVNDLAAPEAVTRLANGLEVVPVDKFQLAPVRPGEPLQFHDASSHLGFLARWCIRRGRNGRVACTRDTPPNLSDVVDVNSSPSIATACFVAEQGMSIIPEENTRRGFRLTFLYRHGQPYISDVEVLGSNDNCRA